MWTAIRTAYRDWGAVLGVLTAAASLFVFVVDAWSMSLSDLLGHVVAAYKLVFHFPFRVLNKIFMMDVPDWARSFLVFWVVTGGMGARVYLMITRMLAEWLQKSSREIRATLASPAMTASLVSRYGSRAALDREVAFTDQRLSEAQETLRRSRLIVFGCLLTGPLFFVGLALYNPPAGRYQSSARKLLLAELFGIVGLVLIGMVFEWSVDEPARPGDDEGPAVETNPPEAG